MVFFLGDQVMAESYNRLLYNGGKGLLPAELGPIVGDSQRRENPYFFETLDFRHPIVADFAGQPDPVRASLTNVKSFRYFRLNVPRDSASQVALKFGNDPAIVEAPRERGRVVLVATSADREWTDWPIHQSYPPVMENIVLRAASGRFEDRNVRVGQPLEQSLPANAAGAEVTVTWPDRDETVREADQKRAKIPLLASGDVSRFRYTDTDRSGTYRVEIGPPVAAISRFAANTDPAESDPAKLDQVALKASLPSWSFFYDNDWRPLQKNAASLGQRGEFHRPFLWGVLALLVIESILAWKFGHYAARSV